MQNETAAQTALTLRIPDISLDRAEGVFVEDYFDRQPHAEMLCDVLVSAEPPAIVALNGEFGSGKSTFLKMCASVMAERKITVVEIDAWQQRYTGDALVDLMGALSDAVPDERVLMRKIFECAGRIARNVAWRVIDDVGHNLIDPDVMADGRTAAADLWRSFKEARAELRDTLASIAAKHDGRIVFLIDELDRCPPAYALDMLDRVRNVLDIRGVVVLYGITRSQLVNAVKQEQGTECDAGAYLARFFDREIQLRTPNWLQTQQLISVQAGRLPHLTAFQQRNLANGWGSLPNTSVALMGGRIRDMQQFLCAADTALWMNRGHDPRAVLTVLTLRHVARSVYDDLAAGDIDGIAASAALCPREPSSQSQSRDLTPWLQAHVIVCSLGNGASLPDNVEFAAAFTSAGAGDADLAAAVHGAARKILNEARDPYFATGSLRSLVTLIEMAEPPI